MPKSPDLTGKRFGKLTALERFPPTNGEASARWLCRCDCGNLVRIITRNLPSKKGCGCTRKTHGYSKKRIYYIWQSMIRRCYDPSSKKYKDYGGRGIQVCDEWISAFNIALIESALGTWPGPGYSIGRINNDGNYCPENCRWETDELQAWNRRKQLNTVSKYRGVWARGKRWVAKIVSSGKVYRLGAFANEEQAARAFDKKAIELRGVEAKLNFPLE